MAPISGFEALGARVAQSAEAPALDRERAAVRARIMDAAFPRRRYRFTGFLLAGVVFGATAFLAWSFILRERGAPDLRFLVGNAPGKVGDFFSVTGAKPLEMRFAEGSSAVLAPGTRSRVASVSPFGADVVIEGGRADVAVVPRPLNRWSVHTGPFVVKVTGTRFSVTWDAAKDEFVLELFEGKVTVAGCLFGEGRPVVAGERVEAACDRGEYRISKIAHGIDGASRSAMVLPDQASVPTDALREDTPGLQPAQRPTSNWLRSAKAGRYAEAYRLAQAEGFDAQCAGADAGDLLFLGDVARLSGHRDAARAAYHAVRSRFAGTTSAAEAAFYLGRIDWDRDADPSSAGKWLRTYLDEKPNGPLSAAALGRLLEIHAASGDRKVARAIARDYLRRFPKGAHATAAAHVLSEPGANDRR